MIEFSHVRCRFRIVRQPDVGASRDPGDERLPDRYEAAEGAAQAAQGRQPALLALDAVPRSSRAIGTTPSILTCNFTDK